MTGVFLDVGVVRIGEYVTRVRSLQGIRGASAAISQATRAELVADIVGVDLHGQIGEADGVLHLQVDNGIDPDAAAQQVLTKLRRALPGADLEATWGEGADYLSARSAINERRAGGRGHRWFPTTAECPVLAPCADCHLRPADTRRSREDLRCRDCQQREDLRGSDSAAQELLQQALPGARFTRDLRQLASGGQDGTREDNHLAVVMADGNGVGALFDSLSAVDVPAETRIAVSQALTAATRKALVAAAAATQDANGFVPVVPVVIGGDDVCVIVAGHQAWLFVRTLLEVFATDIAQRLDAVMQKLDVVPTLSAGVVLQHVSSPIADGYSAAAQLMKAAKRSQTGRAAGVAWIDLTADGGAQGFVHRPAVPFALLSVYEDELRQLATLGASAQKGLQRLLATLPVEDRERYLSKQVARLGLTQQAATFLDGPAERDGLDLHTALDLARWWS